MSHTKKPDKARRLAQLQALGAVHEAHGRACEDARIGIVASQFNTTVVDSLLESALDVLLDKRAVKPENIQIYRVPGAFEIPLMARKIIKRFDALIALGCVVRGETAHFDQVVAGCRQGLVELIIKNKKPIGYGAVSYTHLTLPTKA